MLRTDGTSPTVPVIRFQSALDSVQRDPTAETWKTCTVGDRVFFKYSLIENNG